MPNPGYEQNVLREAGHIINDLLHNDIRKFSENKTDPKEFNFDLLRNKKTPPLDFITIATQTVRQRHSTAATTEMTENVKTIRRVFILCLLLSCTNLMYSTPVHILLADAVEVCGSSRQLLRILNRVGAVSSADTHDRFVTEKAELQKGKHIWDVLPSECFTIASADNFDMLSVHAAVYCGAVQRSYHGTTIQVVQPNPLLNPQPQMCRDYNPAQEMSLQSPSSAPYPSQGEPLEPSLGDTPLQSAIGDVLPSAPYPSHGAPLEPPLEDTALQSAIGDGLPSAPYPSHGAPLEPPLGDTPLQSAIGDVLPSAPYPHMGRP